VRHERDEVRAQRREAAELLDSRPLRLVGADVQHGRRDEAPEKREQFHLVGREGARPFAHERDHPERTRAGEERRGDAAAQTELEQLRLLRIALVRNVLAVDGLTAEHLLEQRALDGPVRPRREDVVRGAPGRGHHLRAARVGEHDRHPLERNQPAELANERVEGLVQLERRAQRPGAAARRLEQVDAASKPVAQTFGFGRLLAGGRSLLAETPDQPPHDQTCEQQNPDREGDAVPDESGRPEAVGTPPLEEGEVRGERERKEHAAAEPEAERRLDDSEDQRVARRAAVLVRVEQREGADHNGVEHEREPAEGHRRDEALIATGEEEQRRADREDAREEPGPELVALRVVLGEDADLEDSERNRPEAHVGEPALSELDPHPRASMRSSAHWACSRSSGSSEAA